MKIVDKKITSYTRNSQVTQLEIKQENYNFKYIVINLYLKEVEYVFYINTPSKQYKLYKTRIRYLIQGTYLFI